MSKAQTDQRITGHRTNAAIAESDVVGCDDDNETGADRRLDPRVGRRRLVDLMSQRQV